MNWRLRVMTPVDIAAAVALKDLAGWNQTTLDWERFLAACPQGCFVAEIGGCIIGTSATIIYGGQLAWIGMVIVASEHRGHGIGKALLQKAIDYLDSQDIPCMKLDATPLGKPLYEKLGFVAEYDIERWMLARAVPPPTHGARNQTQNLDDVLALDRELFGADRSQLLRSIAQSNPQFAQHHKRGGKLSGYAFGRRGSLADQLGPWTARDQATAADLLDQFLERSPRELVFVDCLKSNPWGIQLVKKRGFTFSRPLTRMFRGTNSFPGHTDLMGAILGPEFG